MDIPSFRVKKGQQVAIRSSKAQLAPVLQGIELHAQRRWEASWLEVDVEQRRARVVEPPDEHSFLFPIEVQLVIELYAQRA